ncbi:putative mitochodrial aminopeptidase II protein [Rutstroemia sp. NJR-2017a BBW]|nr:putative mitochodrial aminopeptidase II protein [Rutstroemia sp. NJR-2017a BBW]
MAGKDVLLEPLLPSLAVKSASQTKRESWMERVVLILLSTFAITTATYIWVLFNPKYTPDTAASLHKCAWSSLQTHVSLLSVPPITADEFLTRQQTLSSALKSAGVDAFIAEPSASTAYLANISSSYDLSERPFLVILSASGEASLLVPKFETNRITALEMVFPDDQPNVIQWREEESPYTVLAQHTSFKKVMLDEHARYMIASGLQKNGIEVVPTSQEIQALRAVKSEAELEILSGINEFTLELVRSLQSCIEIGMTQETIVDAASQLFASAGIGKGFWSIVLFGEQAANPHGGGVGRTLKNGEFVLVDIGSSLHSYGSDVTRTILPKKSKVNKELMDIWHLVHDAQTAAIGRMNINETCSVVDQVSRDVIEKKGYGEFFTHRLGHGLGLEMHEHPYLNGVNGEKLKAGEVVTNEPASSMGKSKGFGVRIEDAILVTKKGGIPMTGARAKSPYEP